MEINKLDKVPDGILNDISVSPAAEPEISNSNTVSDKELFETGKTAETTILSNPQPQPTGMVKPLITANTGTPTKPLQAGSFISGDFATNLMDSLIPALIVLGGDYMGYKLEKKGFQLTEKEKQLVSPAMQQYLDSLNINFNNPLYNLLFVIGTVYGSKVIESLPDVKKKTAPPKTVEEKVQATTEIAKRIRLKGEEQMKENRMIANMKEVDAVAYLAKERKMAKKLGFETWVRYKKQFNIK